MTRKMTRKIALFSSIALLGTAGAASAQVASDDPVFVTQVSSLSVELSQDCLGETSSSRAVRACTRLLRNHLMPAEAQAGVFASRARHHMALGREGRAADDFARAVEISPAYARTAAR